MSGESGSRTCVELLADALRRIEASRKTNAIVVQLNANGKRDAQLLDATAAHERGVLHGMLITVKDEMIVAGMRRLNADGTALLPEDECDCVAVRRLRAAGALIVGKTNTPAGCKDWQTYNALYGTTTNPCDARLTCGGSSGGSAAALAAQLSCLELGGDTAGSIRVPANFCGVFGLAPSPHWIETGRDASALGVFGPLANNAADCALALSVLSAKANLFDSIDIQVRSLRVAVMLTGTDAPDVDANVRECVASVVAALQAAGAHVDSSKTLDSVFPARESEKVFLDLLACADKDSDERIALDAKRQQVVEAWDRLFDSFDVVLMPVTVSFAFESDPIERQDAFTPNRTFKSTATSRARRYADHFFFPHFAILGKLPSIAVPIQQCANESATSLPKGVQLMGRRDSDFKLLRCAEMISKITEKRIRKLQQ